MQLGLSLFQSVSWRQGQLPLGNNRVSFLTHPTTKALSQILSHGWIWALHFILSCQQPQRWVILIGHISQMGKLSLLVVNYLLQTVVAAWAQAVSGDCYGREKDGVDDDIMHELLYRHQLS